MKRMYAMIAAMIMISCGSPKQEATTTETATGTAPNALSKDQQAEGWKLLFDGKSMDGWRIYKNAENDTWEVVDGLLHCRPRTDSTGNKRGDLITVDQYENFEFAFDWRIPKGANSGVMFHVIEQDGAPYESGPEYQLIDDTGYPDPLNEGQLTAANYDMHVAGPNKKVNPAGEWNNSKIVVNNKHVEHWLNGEKVLEYDLQSDDWKQRKEKSKWKDEANYGMAGKGHIALQDHNDEIWFRNVIIKPL